MTQTRPDFAAAYAALEQRMIQLAEADSDVYVPDPTPTGPVNYVFVCMEPSFGPWAKTKEHGREQVAAGFRNFLFSLEDFILHHAAREYLCAPGERYHVTDLSKGAMLVKRAGKERTARYDRWHGLLEEELELLSMPGARVIAVGSAVTKHMQKRNPARTVTQVLHYSGQNARAWKEGVVGHEAEFDAFKDKVTLEDIVRTATAVMEDAQLAEPFRGETLKRLKKRKTLSESRKKLLFNYKLAFDALTGT